ncbi:hypothetical protein SPBRAN_1769 [uncultured Candidatus Thioglobus sp.]|nr:hypothetical protein SPBRAN_1769 [uncultured Candidatus Thioglobus sp.]
MKMGVVIFGLFAVDRDFGTHIPSCSLGTYYPITDKSKPGPRLIGNFSF